MTMSDKKYPRRLDESNAPWMKQQLKNGKKWPLPERRPKLQELLDFISSEIKLTLERDGELSPEWSGLLAAYDLLTTHRDNQEDNNSVNFFLLGKFYRIVEQTSVDERMDELDHHMGITAYAHGPKNFVMRYIEPSVNGARMLGNNSWIDFSGKTPKLLD